MNFKPLGLRLKIGPETLKMVKNGHWDKRHYAKNRTPYFTFFNWFGLLYYQGNQKKCFHPFELKFCTISSHLKIGPKAQKMLKNGQWEKIQYAKTWTLTPLFGLFSLLNHPIFVIVNVLNLLWMRPILISMFRIKPLNQRRRDNEAQISTRQFLQLTEQWAHVLSTLCCAFRRWKPLEVSSKFHD